MEALAAGTPVIAGRGPCVEEYFGSCAQIVDPTDFRMIARAIEVAMSGGSGCEQPLARSYSWSTAGRELVKLYEPLLAQ